MIIRIIMATMNDIARLASVSQATVSSVLNAHAGSIRVSEATRQRIQRIAAEVGYLPNSSALAMRTGRFGCVGLLMSTIGERSNITSNLLSGLLDALSMHDLHLTLARVLDERLHKKTTVPKMLRQWLVDGLLINYTHEIPEELLDLSRTQHLPAIWLNSSLALECVRPDDFAAGRLATERLLAYGHQRILYVVLGTSHYSDADRYAGYAAAMEAVGLSAQRLCFGPEECCQQAVTACLASSQRPTAVLAYMPTIARCVLTTALRQGLRVPQDLSLVTFDEYLVDWQSYPITTWKLPTYEMGQVAVAMLLEKMATPACQLPSRILPLTLAEGATCAPPPQAR
jgi:LacI family transcriptional regulator